MKGARLAGLALGGLALGVLGGVALAQIRQPPIAQQAPVAPVPAEVGLTPSRLDAAALAEARQNPIGARMTSVLANTPILPQIQASPVPVLGPPDPALLGEARFYPGQGQYTLVVRPEGRIVEIFGSVRAFQAPEGVTLTPPPDARAAIRGRRTPLAAAVAEARSRGLSDILTERTEYGVDVSFNRFGVAYSVTFICEARASLECSDAAAVQFASRLELIGGGQ